MSVLLNDINKYDRRMLKVAHKIFNNTFSNRDYTESEKMGIVQAIREYYLDHDNYPKAFNIRLARRFDDEEMENYFKQCESAYRKFFEHTIYAGGSSFYFGFNYV